MKLKTLLLGSLLVTSSSAFAELTVQERPYPSWTDVPAAVLAPSFDNETTYGIYNVEGQGFLAGANDWTTRASIITTAGAGSSTTCNYDATHGFGWKVNVEDAENNLVSFSAWDARTPEYRTIFANDLAAIWVDNNSGVNNKTWQFTAGAEGKYTITNTAEIFAGKVLAVKTGAEGAADTRTYFVAPGTEGYCSDWIFVAGSTTTYLNTNRQGNPLVQHNNALAIYNAAKALWDLMVEADGQGMQVPAKYQEAYADEATTVSQFNELVTEFRAEYDDYLVSIATLQNPVDVTSWFNANNGAGNWKTVFTGTGTKGSNSWNTWSDEGNAGNDGTMMTTPFHETWVAKGNAPLSDLRHQIDTVRVRPGAYRVTARARCYSEVEGATELHGAYLFANDFRTAFIDNNKGDASTTCQNQQEGLFSYKGMLGYYAPNANGYAIVPADGNEDGKGFITFGFYTKDPNFNWVAHKDYKIEYLGNADDAIKEVRDNSELTIEKMDESTPATKSMIADFNQAFDDYKTAATGAEISANYLIVSRMGADIEENIKAWTALKAAIDLANERVVNNDDVQGDAKDAFSDEVLDFEDMVDPDNGYLLSTQEVKDTTAYILEKIEYVINTDIQPGGDVTFMLQNPDFSKGTAGWQGGVTVNESCGEKYGSGNANVYQDVNIKKAGVYEISCQGFYRQYRMDNQGKEAWYNFFNSDGTVKYDAETGKRVADVLGYLYLNDNLTPLKSVFEEQVPNGEVMSGGDVDPLNDGAGLYWYANTMKQAAECFAYTPEGADVPLYTVSAKAMLREGDAMRIGVQASLGLKGNNNDWVIFDNFKLTYLGVPSDEVMALLRTNLDELKPYLDEVFDKNVKFSADSLYNAGEAAYAAASDADKMFEIASNIPPMIAKITASQAIFAELKAAHQELLIAGDDAVASDEIVDEADGYAGDVNKMLNGTTPITDNEAKAAILQCAKYVGMLEVDDTAVPTAEKPVKYTPYMVSASFERGGKNSILGWNFNKQDKDGKDITPGGITSGQTAALAAEYYEKTYDMYQAVERLPKGMFNVSMKGFFRHTNADKDWAQVTNDTASVAMMYVTIQGSNDSIFCPIRHVTADATKTKIISTSSATEIGDWTPFLNTDGDATAWHLPNNMLGAVDYFNYEAPDTSFYDNSINVMLNEGDVLVIGVKQDTCQAGDWVMMDNFRILYYGDVTGMEVGAQTSSYENPSPKVTVLTVRGDANGDGEIGMPDVMFVINYILGTPAETFNFENADANLDGEIGMPDVMYIINYILNGKFPDEEQ